jgi:hypothetical protein
MRQQPAGQYRFLCHKVGQTLAYQTRGKSVITVGRYGEGGGATDVPVQVSPPPGRPDPRLPDKREVSHYGGPVRGTLIGQTFLNTAGSLYKAMRDVQQFCGFASQGGVQYEMINDNFYHFKI